MIHAPVHDGENEMGVDHRVIALIQLNCDVCWIYFLEKTKKIITEKLLRSITCTKLHKPTQLQ